jgi:hypothetical protein
VELYIQSPICLHGVSTGITLPFTFTLIISFSRRTLLYGDGSIKGSEDRFKTYEPSELRNRPSSAAVPYIAVTFLSNVQN